MVCGPRMAGDWPDISVWARAAIFSIPSTEGAEVYCIVSSPEDTCCEVTLGCISVSSKKFLVTSTQMSILLTMLIAIVLFLTYHFEKFP